MTNPAVPPIVAQVELLTKLGVYVEPGFLSAAECRALTTEMTRQAGTAGVVYDDGVPVVDLETKRLIEIALDQRRYTEMAARLDALLRRMAAHFHPGINGHEGATFYRYDAGGFYRAHRDRFTAADAIRAGHDRRASVVLFLNDHSEGIGPRYDGGDLILYGVLDDHRLTDYGVSVPAQAGLLVAFRPDLRHEVTTVTGGTRCVAVSRFVER